MPITSAQCRAARAYLDWNQAVLQLATGIGRTTLIRFEQGGRHVESTPALIEMALVQAGAVFVPGGVVFPAKADGEAP